MTHAKHSPDVVSPAQVARELTEQLRPVGSVRVV
jgi:hypothetical protein